MAADKYILITPFFTQLQFSPGEHSSALENIFNFSIFIINGSS